MFAHKSQDPVMRLPGRIAAAMEVLADIETRHRPATQALRDWGLSHRFAGSGDRVAIGNIVHDALRRRASLTWLMGAESPRAVALAAAVRGLALEPAALAESFSGDPHAPAPLTEDEVARLSSPNPDDAPDHVRAEIPAWLAPAFAKSLGDGWVAEGAALAERPPLDLRVNTLKATRDKVAADLAHLGVSPTPLSPVGLRIAAPSGAGRLPNVTAEGSYRRGRVDIQDEASQLCALLVGARPGEQVLDFCAGAGGKTLALSAAMENRGQVHAFDADRNRLAPIHERLKRAGTRNIQVRAPGGDGPPVELLGLMDRVLVDAPCSGTGVWRRRPDAKWRLSAEALSRRVAEQRALIVDAARFVRTGGVLVYATCSLLNAENDDTVSVLLAADPSWKPTPAADAWQAALGAPMPEFLRRTAHGLLLTPATAGTDGFYVAVLERAE